MAEKEKRKLNIIVANLPESGKDTAEDRKHDDQECVRQLVSTISDVSGDCINNPVRLGKVTIGQNVKPRLRRLKIRDEATKKKIMQNAHILNRKVTNPRDRVFSNNDSTPKEKEIINKPRQDLKTRREKRETD